MNKTNYKYEETFKVRRYLTDFYEELSPMGLISYMEVLATNHAKVLNCFDSEKIGYYWILRSSKYEMIRMPKNNETVSVVTWPVGLDRLKSLRKFEIYIEDELIGKAYQYWLSLSYTHNKPVISDHYKQIIDNLEIPKSDWFKIDRINLPEELTFKYSKKVFPKDIDIHQHMNNVRYIDTIYDAIDMDILKDYQILNLQIDYLKENKVQDELNIYTKRIEDEIYINGLNNKVSSFKAKVKLSRRK